MTEPKVDNCQAGVFVSYTAPAGHALLHRRLFLPQRWFSPDQRERWEKCRIPNDTPFQTKPQLALDLVNNVMASGLFQGEKLFLGLWR